MANISVNTTELLQLLDITPTSHNIMLTGAHGIGKSEILIEYFKGKGIRTVSLFLGQMADPGDLLGLPSKDEKTGRTTFMPPFWWPIDGNPICLFLDELNRARPEILSAVMDLTLNRTLAGRRLPEGSRVISAVNVGDNYQVTDLDPALVSRFNIVAFRPTVEEWLLWARKNGLDQRVIGFIEENHAWLDKEPDARLGIDTGIDVGPNRRAWKRVSDIISNSESLSGVFTKAISSIVGPKAASAFIANASEKRILSGRDVLHNLDKVMDKLNDYQLHELSTINDGIFRYLEVEKISDNDLDKVKKNIDAYFDFLSKKKKEAAAHFANIYIGQTYPNAVKFIAKSCPILTMCMVAYVRSIN